MKRSIVFVIVCLVHGTPLTWAQELPKAKAAFVLSRSFASDFATQAAAADQKHVYAISDHAVVKYDRASGKELAKSSGEAHHLNSGFLLQGKLYCAHSNYPRQPHQSDIRVLDPASMELTIFHTFKNPPGSLTWAVRKDDHWWCHFAHYGKDNAQSVLVKYADGWKEAARWSYPAELIADWGTYSLSGGLWLDDHLLVTGHDKRLIYKLALPKEGKVIEVVGIVRSPFAGQGLAIDPSNGGLIGIDRARKQVIFARFDPAR
jgi:hypothetical protein